MNRIVLIGNGFDLAHDKKTSYKHFIDDYWSGVINDIKGCPDLHYRNNQVEITFLRECSFFGGTLKDIEAGLGPASKVKPLNRFFFGISKMFNGDNTWVDIENEYYSRLVELYETNENKANRRLERHSGIKTLNKEFDEVKELLVDYLNRVEKEYEECTPNKALEEKKNLVWRKIYSPINPNDLSEEAFDAFVKDEISRLARIKKKYEAVGEISKMRDENLLKKISYNVNADVISRLLMSFDSPYYFELVPQKILFLNFNYTDIDDMYKKPPLHEYIEEISAKSEFINVHGSLTDLKNNPIIFGYGDELDERYKQIEGCGNNDYLENIKSVNYSNAGNYKKLLQFINSDTFQVFVFGHSCGLSDRTLLNTLFAHKNCASIKCYYHKKSDDSDNFSDVVKNISRCFNSKASMRDRVVDKTRSEPLMP